MTLRSGQLKRQREAFKRTLPDVCTMYSTSNTVRTLYIPASNQYPDGIPCRVTEKPLRTDYDNAGNPIYTRYFDLSLPGDLLVPTSSAQFIISSLDNLTVQSLAAVAGMVSEQVSIVVVVKQVDFQ